MSELNIVTIPSDLLFEVSRLVEEDEFGPELEQKMVDMAAAMYHNRGTGLAGVQVGDLRRILVADLGHVTGAGYQKELIKMVNPEVLEVSEDEVTIVEGCLSYPGLSQSVSRPKVIKVSYLTPDGESHKEEFRDLQAVIVQHEIDHLNGVTLFEKASPFKRRRYKKKVEKQIKRYVKGLEAMARPR